jgi:hypothetical protein
MSTHIVPWFRGAIPDGWFTSPASVTVDREEIVVVGTLPEPAVTDLDDDGRRAAWTSRIAAHREATRDHRIRIAAEAEAIFGRKVSWGARCGERTEMFTNLSVPVMTRLRFEQRQVLDTLIDAGVARSRSEALAWCVRLVGQHEADWIAALRDALTHVEALRASGPGQTSGAADSADSSAPDAT